MKRLGWQATSGWVIRRSGLFDLRWYAAQLEGRVPGLSAAVAHYVLRGRRAGLSPSPLFEPSWYAPKDWGTRHADPFGAYLQRAAAATATPHPLFDPATWTALHPAAATHPAGPLGHFLQTAGPDTAMPLDPAMFAPFAAAAGGAANGGAAAEASEDDGPDEGPSEDDDGPDADPAYPDDVLARAAGHGPRPPGGLRWARARAALESALAQWRRDEARRRAPRVCPDFDLDGEAALVEHCAAASLPPNGDGPLVSVILPVKNRRDQVRAAVASVRAQTLTDWELVVVDDGSTDGSLDVLRELAHADERIRVVCSGTEGESRGVCAARNAGAAAARGRYVSWLDSDNRWTPHFLRTMVVTMSERGWPLAYAAVETVQASGRRYRAFDPGDDPGEVLALLAVANHVDLNVLVVERALLESAGGFDESLRRTVDYDLVWRLARRTVPHYVGAIGVVYDADHEAADRITVKERPSWREVVKNRRLVDWPALADAAEDRVPGRLSVVVVAEEGWPGAWVSVGSVLRAAGPADDLEVLVVDDGGRRADAVLLSTLPLLDGRVRFLRTPVRCGRPLAGNLAVAASTGSTVVLLQAGIEVWPGWARPLQEALADPLVSAAAPLVLDRTGRLVAAGLGDPREAGDRGDVARAAGDPQSAAQVAGGPVPLLAGHHVEDARRLGGLVAVAAVTDEVVAVRAADLIAVQGLDPLYVAEQSVPDLCLRLPGRTVLATRSVADHATRLRPGVALEQARRRVTLPPDAAEGDRRLLAWRWERRPAGAVAGEVAGSGGVRAVGEVAGSASARVAGAGARAEVTGSALRWTIKTALPVGPDAVRWGDLHFAQALAAALERLGQRTVIDHRPAMGLPPAQPEDVVLVLRGLEAAPGPCPGGQRIGDHPGHGLHGHGHDGCPGVVRLMWVISHPGDVTDDELRAQHRVFAASTVWARQAGARAGAEVLPLLQCTDPERFRPDAALPDTGDAVLFVGNSRNVFRPVVRDLLAAGVDVAIYGDKWDRFLGPGRVRGRHVPNERLAAAYASAGVVLNDHWDDMRAEGFYSNRLFDAAACGARIVSDHIPGMQELFGGLVRTFEDPDELIRLVRTVPDGFPEPARRRELAGRVAADHSFDARARTLLDEVRRLRHA